MIDTNLRARDVFAVVNPITPGATAGTTPLERFITAMEAIAGTRPTTSLACRQWETVVDGAMVGLDELVASARPALEHALELVRAFGDDLQAEEVAAAERSAEERRQAALDAEVARRVSGAEAERLRAIEDDVRAQLATTAGGK